MRHPGGGADLYTGLVRLHYPVLHRLEARGYLRSMSSRGEGGRRRRVYRITAAGRRALAAAKIKVRELFGELFASI